MKNTYPNSLNTVKVIQDSVNSTGNRLTTFEIETYRYIWAEILTHKMLSKNAQSSRAVPTASVLKVNSESPVVPIVWGKNQGGMSASEAFNEEDSAELTKAWTDAADYAFELSKIFSEVKVHKMWANRITEPYSRIKAVISATEFDNFFWLRIDPEAAQPEIVDLAQRMQFAYEDSLPMLVLPGQAHVPYVNREIIDGEMRYFSQGEELTLEDALKISASCCAQVSYRKLDNSIVKALEIYDKLFNGAKPHYSPTEHQGIAMKSVRANVFHKFFPSSWEKGVSHMDRNDNFWSGNLKGFIQYRKLLELQSK